jgi:hypothetical protein
MTANFPAKRQQEGGKCAIFARATSIAGARLFAGRLAFAIAAPQT